jgi:hypothetical protein
MENPGSFNNARESYPELTEAEFLSVWESELLAFQKFVKSNIVPEAVQLELF